MFMNDPDFDDEFQQQHSPGFQYEQAFPSPDSKQRQENDGLPAFGNAGMGTPQNGRARALAQQREIQMKKRQANLLSGGGMVRSSLDSAANNSPYRQSTDNQFTPAVRQFSQPKDARKDPSADHSPEKESEFGAGRRAPRSVSKSASNTRYGKSARDYSDEEEEDPRVAEAAKRAEARREKESRDGGNSRDRDRDRDYGRGGDRDRGGDRGGDRDGRGSTGARRNGNEGTSRGRSRFDDGEDDEEEEDYRQGYGNNKASYGNKNGSSRRDQRDEAPSSSSGYRNGNNGSNRDDDYDRSRSSQQQQQQQGGSSSQNKWAGATGGREVNNSDRSDRNNNNSNYRNNNSSNAAEVAVVQAAPQAAMVGSNAQGRNQQPSQAVPLAIVAPDLRDMRAFLCSPLPKNNGTLQCYIRRNKSGTNKLFPIYSLYLKEGDVFLMASKKRPKNKTSNYLISMDQNDLNRTGRGYLGKLRSNFVGTEFQVFDSGVNPKDSEPDEAANSNGSVRCELGSVMYAANVLGSRGPRKMQVALPGLNEHGDIIPWKDNGGAEGGHDNNSSNGEDILTRMKDRNLRDLNYLINKPPRWNEQVGAYVLNFNGRVTMASVKNFQLVDPDEQNAVVLQFGRVGKDEFTMDLQHPISPFQAFAVTLSSFDSKIACD